MFEPLENADTTIAALLFLVYWFIGYRMGQLARLTPLDAQRSARRIGVWIRVGFCLFVLRLVGIGWLWTYGWDFAENRVWVSLPLVTIPLVAVAVWSLPRLRKILDESDVDRLDPKLVVPSQAVAVGGLLTVWVGFVSRPIPPHFDEWLTHGGPLAVVTALLWLRQTRRRPVTRSMRARVLTTVAGFVAILGLVAGSIFYGISASRLPDHMSMMDHNLVDYGGGPVTSHTARTSVEALTGPRAGPADKTFTVTAEAAQIQLSSGKSLDGWTYNGASPGPEIRVTEGDVVEIKLINKLPDVNVTLHWHGLDVPNAEDGVAGLTQNVVTNGGEHTYRFRAEQVGSFWYHTHQASSEAVMKGLFGSLIVEPRTKPMVEDITVMSHVWHVGEERVSAFGTKDTLKRKRIKPGTPVLIRLTNTAINPADDIISTEFALTGTPFRVTAIDGTPLNGPTELRDTKMELANGGRHDLSFIMLNGPVRLANLNAPDAGLLLEPTDGPVPTIPADLPSFDPLSYGIPTPTKINPAGTFDRRFKLIMDDGLSFHDGVFGLLPSINGTQFPDTPTLMVRENEVIHTTLINRSHEVHPMHLHGHHALVLSRNGVPPTGSPWWTDTLDVRPGEIFEIAFVADNPGVWMDHCHNLEHARNGMVMHLSYEGVTSPYHVGHKSGNQPE
ncbi:multicopper oxidase family protein [Kibdelosporangium philippinense]|uniref:Multicopper oxidase family protein n=1 Tax=Kibdelosporangium philippinense TaxID=211113 RepID=A0ABS8ZH02_9PSEU|nr:multicopper oxidase family protein [Kibdelosporangium philippinense]MCE7006328.1 multicopper oxidase family protein [Kibdelosporangium philippinense]